LLRAYDLVENDLRTSNNNEEPPIRDGSRPVVTITTTYGQINRLVKEAVARMTKPFTIRGLHEDVYNDVNISLDSVTTAMIRIREEQPPVVRVKVPGKGRRATIFEEI